jgi:hypothetical protein
MEEEVSREFPAQQPKKKSRWWKILIIISIILIILYVVARIVLYFYLVDYMNKTIETVYFRFDNGKLGEDNSTKATNIEEVRGNFQYNQAIVQKQIGDLKTKGEIKFTVREATAYCEDGTIERFPESAKPRVLCGEEYYYNITRGDLKEFTLNDYRTIPFIVTETALLTLQEPIIYSFENPRKSLSDTIASILEVLHYLACKIDGWIFWMDIISLERNQTSLIEQDLKQAIIALEEFDKTLEVPTEQEINNLPIKENLLKMSENMENEGSIYSSALKQPLWQKLFISYNMKRIAKKVDENQKATAIKILKSLEQDKNAFSSIEKKMYLNKMVKCQDEWFPDPKMNGEPCWEKYINDTSDSINLALNTTEVEGVCHSNYDCGGANKCINNNCTIGRCDYDSQCESNVCEYGLCMNNVPN